MTNKRVPVITDVHYGARADSPLIYENQGRFYNEVFWPTIDKENGVTDILHLGDLVDRRKFLNYITLDFAKKTFFRPAQERGIRIHWVLGNHDLPYKHSLSISGADAFREFDNLIVYKDATVVPFDGVPTLLMPWLCEENTESSMKTMKAFDGAVVAGHFEFSGFEMYRGIPNMHGDPTSDYEHFAMVMSGHYHHKSSRKNIHYLGSPFELSWSDYGDMRGFHWWTPQKNLIELVENTHHLFYRFVYDDSNAPTTYVRDLLANVRANDLKQKIVKVVVKHKTNPLWWETFADAMMKLDAHDVQFVDEIMQQSISNAVSSQDENAAMDTITMINWYVNSLIWPNDETKEAVRNLMSELYHEASDQTNLLVRN